MTDIKKLKILSQNAAEEESNGEFIAAVNPQVVLELIDRLEASYELINRLTKAAVMTEGIARTRSYFNKTKYEKICSKISELRERSGVGPYVDREFD